MSTDPIADARRDYQSWTGCVSVDEARTRARLLAAPADRAYWSEYADEVERLQAAR